MKLRFDTSFNGRHWPGVLSEVNASAGEEWVGPRGFLEVLETQLGLTGPVVPHAERVAGLVPSVVSTAGFWSKSAERYPYDVAQQLLAWRDQLCEHGWNGAPVASRIAQLAAVTAAAEPGLPDRLAVALDVMDRRSCDIERVEHIEPRSYLPRMWQEVFATLESMGSTVVERPLAMPDASGDLARARSEDGERFVPAVDGTLLLLRPHGLLEAAEHAAAWLAAQPNLDDTVIVGGDVVLDEALHRYGLPTTGASGRTEDCLMLQILPLVLEVGRRPADAHRALELLTLPRGPVPRGMANRLIKALQEWPAVDSDEWRRAMASSIDALPPDRAQRVGQRMEQLWSTVDGASYPAATACDRIGLVQHWARGVANGLDSGASEEWSLLIQHCSALGRLIQSTGQSQFTPSQLGQLIQAATRSVPAPARYPAQAGLLGLSGPECMCGPARNVVWWNFTQENANPLRRVPWSPSELAALRAADVTLPDRAIEAVRQADRWRRPLLQATHRVLLVSPLVQEDGEEAHPHPLWDEIVARVAPRQATRLISSGSDLLTTAATAVRTVKAAPTPRRSWRLPDDIAVAPRDSESPSSLGALVGCPLSYVLKYTAKLRTGWSAALAEGGLLKGRLAHEIFLRVLLEAELTPDLAAARAGEVFDTEGPRLAGPLFRPGYDGERSQVREVIASSARELVRHFNRCGLRIEAAEWEISGHTTCGPVGGRVDILTHPPAVVDLKWSGHEFYRKLLRDGIAYQVATYAHLLGPDVPTAYFMLSNQRLMSTDVTAFGSADRVHGPSANETWRGFQRAVTLQRQAIAQREVMAPGNPDTDGRISPDRSTLGDGLLVLEASCRFCEFGALCGKQFGGDGL